MILTIDFIDEVNGVTEEQCNQLEELLNLAARQEGIAAESEVSITFVDNEKIREINREFRGKDQPTDVISFAMEEMGEGEIKVLGTDMPTVLGDLIISIPRTIEQAGEYGHSFMRELGFLTVHGFLHLIGYDHETQEDEEKMFSRQREILDQYGLTR